MDRAMCMRTMDKNKQVGHTRKGMGLRADKSRHHRHSHGSSQGMWQQRVPKVSSVPVCCKLWRVGWQAGCAGIGLYG